MRFPAIRFLAYFCFCVLLLLIFIAFVYLDKGQQQHLLVSLSQLPEILSKGKTLIQFMDDWNYIALVFLFCTFIIILCLNGMFIQRFFPSPAESSNSFTVSGLIWLVRISSNILLLIFQFTLACYTINFFVSTPRIVEIREIPAGKYTVLLLGTSKYIGNSTKINQYYQSRIEKTIELYKSGYVDKIIISGDHSGSYNEPKQMYSDLIVGGIKNISIVLDGNGYRTFDSILHAKEISAASNIIIISQYFHLERALFLASQQGLNAFGLPANGSLTKQMVKREWFAKTKVLLDIYIFNFQAMGVYAQPRRHFDFKRSSDVIILLFVLSLVSVAGRLTRLLISF